MKVIIIDNITCKLGQSARENWELLDKALSTHLFFHLSSFSSGYLIMECKEKPSPESIRKAAEICKNGTKYRNLKDLKVDYTQCSNVMKGDKLGEAEYKSWRKVKQIKM